MRAKFGGRGRAATVTSLIGPLSAFADVVISGWRWRRTVASSRVSPLARPVIATFAFACAWLVTAASEAMRAPGWTIVLGGTVLVVSIVLISATLHIWTQRGDGGESGPGQGDDKGGGGPGRRRPDAPQHGGGGGDPSWWTEFERQLALYVDERERDSVPRSAGLGDQRLKRRVGIGQTRSRRRSVDDVMLGTDHLMNPAV